MQDITAQELEAACDGIAATMKPWESGTFKYLKKIEDAARNHGRVDMMGCTKYGCAAVAVKKMPNSWVEKGKNSRSNECECPWRSIAILRELARKGYSATCQLLDVFQDDHYTYVVTELAAGGDLFAWCLNRPLPTAEREAEMLPLVAQMFSAVECLHTLGIAHRDLSLENILLSGGKSEQVKLIDFGMAHVGRMCPAATTLGPGKPSYQAPELHEKRAYDGFKADAFSLGVVVYAMAMGNYPWQSTKPGRSRIFDWVHGHGVLPFLQRQEIAGYFSEELIELIAVLLHIQPAQRLGLVQSGTKEEQTIWDCKWVAAPTTQGQWRAMSSNSVSTMATETESDAEEQGTGRPASGFDAAELAGFAC